MDKETWEQVERMHNLIPMEKQGRWNFLTLVCTGHTTGWAASFDFNLSEEWYEYDQIGGYPFAARGETAAIAIRRAVDRAFKALH
jgi:hypothetical protein